MKIVMREGGEKHNILRFKFSERKEPVSTQQYNKPISIFREDEFRCVEKKVGVGLTPLVLEILRIIPSLSSLKVRPNQIILGLEVGIGWSLEDEGLTRGAIRRNFYQESIVWFVHRWNENQKPL